MILNSLWSGGIVLVKVFFATVDAAVQPVYRAQSPQSAPERQICRVPLPIQYYSVSKQNAAAWLQYTFLSLP